MKVKIEVGKFYISRDGKKVRIYATDGKGDYPVHGAFYSNGGWDSLELTKYGRYYSNGEINSSDIVREWVEPLKFDWECLPAWIDRYIAMDKNGKWFAYDKAPRNPDRDYWVMSGGSLISIEENFSPTNYYGTSLESLHENPKYKNNEYENRKD